VLDVVVYLSAAAGVVVLARRAREIKQSGFNDLGALLGTRFPELQAGFTLREGLAKARQVVPGLDWSAIDEALVAYEEQKYGGFTMPSVPQPAVAALFDALQRPGL
jgi:hypothetical protein